MIEPNEITPIPVYSVNNYYNKTGDLISVIVTFQLYEQPNSFNVTVRVEPVDFGVETLDDKTNKQIIQKGREKAAQLILGA